MLRRKLLLQQATESFFLHTCICLIESSCVIQNSPSYPSATRQRAQVNKWKSIESAGAPIPETNHTEPRSSICEKFCCDHIKYFHAYCVVNSFVVIILCVSSGCQPRDVNRILSNVKLWMKIRAMLEAYLYWILVTILSNLFNLKGPIR